jgi:hypothetical protein
MSGLSAISYLQQVPHKYLKGTFIVLRCWSQFFFTLKEWLPFVSLKKECQRFSVKARPINWYHFLPTLVFAGQNLVTAGTTYICNAIRGEEQTTIGCTASIPRSLFSSWTKFKFWLFYWLWIHNLADFFFAPGVPSCSSISSQFYLIWINEQKCTIFFQRKHRKKLNHFFAFISLTIFYIYAWGPNSHTLLVTVSL